MPTKPKTIRQLFEAREKATIRGTDKIFAAMVPAMEVINDLMGLEDIKKVGGNLVWDDLSLIIGDAVEEPLVIMVGVVSFPPGCEIETTNGDKIKVTVDTEPYFRRLVRAGLPASVAIQSKEEVAAYFKKMEQEMEKQADVSEMDRVLTTETEFDLTKLTDEQRAAYDASTGYKFGKA